MRWRGARQSTNVEDRRGIRGPVMIGGGISTIVVILLLVCMGADPRALLVELEQANQQGGVNVPVSAEAEDEMKQFVATVLADTEDVWHAQFRRMGKQYREPTLVIFNGEVGSACGYASAAVGPFYCPADEKVYIDLRFYDQLRHRLDAPGDFAQAYVIAHEIGHHVQNQLGISDQVHSMRGRVSEAEYNELSVRLELQADFFAGVWAHHAQRTRQILEPGDIEEALTAASAIGDDKLQMEGQGYVVPDSFTHGTSAQRVRWFRKGFETGDMEQGNTFDAVSL